MKLKKYNDFVNLLNEFNNADKNLIKSLDSYFTIAIEYEICSKEDPEEEPLPEEDEAIENAILQTKLDLKRGKLVGSYGFSDVKYTDDTFINNESKMLSEHPKFDKYSKKKKRELHKEYKTITWFNDFIEILISYIDFDDQIETAENLEGDNFDDDLEKAIAKRFSYNIQLFGFMQNVEYLKQMAEENLPNFWKKWSSTFKFELEGDADKPRILEFSPKTYLTGISQGIEQLNDFYNDFTKQDYWVFNNRTALHINIGVTKSVDWNPIKGLLLMGDYDRETKVNTPYVFKEIEWRYGNRFTGSLIDSIKKNLKGEMTYKYSDVKTKELKYGDLERDKVKEKIDLLNTRLKGLKHMTRGKSKKEIKAEITNIEAEIASLMPVLWNYDIRNKEAISNQIDTLKSKKDLLDLNDVDSFEEHFNKFLIKANTDFYIKEFGVKLSELDKNYVEFRYVGTKSSDDSLGGVTAKTMIDKMYYFCYIVYLMTDKEYKRKDYLKKLYKLTSEIKEYIK
jgi:hypothetical protein